MTHATGAVRMGGTLGLQVIRRGSPAEVLARKRPAWPVFPHPAMDGRPTVRQVLEHGLPRRGLPEIVNEWRTRNFRAIWRAIREVAATNMLHRFADAPVLLGSLYLTKIDVFGNPTFLGLAGVRVVTTVGVGYIVDAFQNSVELENMKFHGVGEADSPGEAVGDTDLVSEITTEYGTDNTRPTGTTTEGASANIYRTVGTATFDGAVAIVEHGIFSSATVGAGVLLDRTVFAVVNLSSGESLQSTYDLTVSAGG